jgi:hypothetical protein
MTLGCGAMAGNSTSDNVGPQHLINIKRLAYTVRKPEEAFEMPLDYDKAPNGLVAGGAVDRDAVVAAVERYLAARGVGGAGLRPAQASASSSGGTCGCSTPSPKESSIASVAAEVVDRILAGRGGAQGSGGYS